MDMKEEFFRIFSRVHSRSLAEHLAKEHVRIHEKLLKRVGRRIGEERVNTEVDYTIHKNMTIDPFNLRFKYDKDGKRKRIRIVVKSKFADYSIIRYEILGFIDSVGGRPIGMTETVDFCKPFGWSYAQVRAAIREMVADGQLLKLGGRKERRYQLSACAQIDGVDAERLQADDVANSEGGCGDAGGDGEGMLPVEAVDGSHWDAGDSVDSVEGNHESLA